MSLVITVSPKCVCRPTYVKQVNTFIKKKLEAIMSYQNLSK